MEILKLSINTTCWFGDHSGVEPLDHIPNSQVKRKSRQWYLVVMTRESRLSPSLQVVLKYIHIKEHKKPI